VSKTVSFSCIGLFLELEQSVFDGCICLSSQPRTLIALTGDSRYIWRHAIASRKKDLHKGKLIPRRRRVSLTLRTMQVRRVKSSLCASSSISFTLALLAVGVISCQPYRRNVSSDKVAVKLEGDSLRAPKLETTFVSDVYDAIAPHFSQTRVRTCAVGAY